MTNTAPSDWLETQRCPETGVAIRCLCAPSPAAGRYSVQTTLYAHIKTYVGRERRKEGGERESLRTTPRPIRERGMSYVEQTVRSPIVVGI